MMLDRAGKRVFAFQSQKEAQDLQDCVGIGKSHGPENFNPGNHVNPV